MLPETATGARALCAEAAALASSAAREVRAVSYRMHPPLLDEAGLAPALRWFARKFSERSGIAVRAEIRDVGRGVAPGRAGENPFAAGVGLAGLRECLRELGGELEFESLPGRGATLRATLPASPAPQRDLRADAATRSGAQSPAKERR